MNRSSFKYHLRKLHPISGGSRSPGRGFLSSPSRVLLASALIAAAGIMMARPAGMLLWHRLRIITGMPRMAIANPSPDHAALMTASSNGLIPGTAHDSDESALGSVGDPVAGRALAVASSFHPWRVTDDRSIVTNDGRVLHAGDTLRSGGMRFVVHEVRPREVLLGVGSWSVDTGILLSLEGGAARLVPEG